MSESESAAKQPKSRNGVRTAWWLLAAFIVVEIGFYIHFEWHNAVTEFEDEYPFFSGFAWVSFLQVSLCLTLISLFRRRWKAALRYAALFAFILYWPLIGNAFDLRAKAYFFSAYPEMCPEGSPKPGYRVALCYKYWFMDSRTALVFNPGDELAKPYTSWRQSSIRNSSRMHKTGFLSARKSTSSSSSIMSIFWKSFRGVK